MTNQLQGEILFQGWKGGAGEDGWVHTPWIPVRGDHAVFGVQVTYNGGATLSWEVQTRTLEDPSTVTSIVTGQTGTATARNSTPLAQELVRYRFNTGSTASTTVYVVFRALQPSWQVDRVA
jgi:hypothetical protein